MKGVQPKKTSKQSRISIADPRKGRMVSVNPYSATAKKLYRHYIEQEGQDPAMVVPPDLKYYPDSGRFRRMKQPKKPMIEARYAYKNYLGAYTLHNLDQLPAFEGFDLIRKFTAMLREYMQKVEAAVS